MTVTTFKQPSFTTQDAATYKAAIDNSTSALAKTSNAFAPHEMATPGAGITIDAGVLPDGTVIAAQNVTGIGAATTNPRIDRVWFDPKDNTVKRQVGTEAASPVPPTVQFGGILLAQVAIPVTGSLVITNAMIIDERTFVQPPLVAMVSGYVQMVDPNGYTRMLLGNGATDPRIILRLHTNDGTSKIMFQSADGTNIASIDGTGKMRLKSNLVQNTTP